MDKIHITASTLLQVIFVYKCVELLPTVCPIRLVKIVNNYYPLLCKFSKVKSIKRGKANSYIIGYFNYLI